MQTRLLFSTAAALLFTGLGEANTISFDIARNPAVQEAQLRARAAVLKRGLQGRADTVNAALTNDATQGLYFANVTVGTPAQKFGLQIDTGSSDVWVPSSSASQCTDTQNGLCPLGSFNQDASKTFTIVEQDGFNISYVDGTGSVGDYFTDTFTIGGATLNNFEMGLATTTSIGTGIMGIGYNTSESNVDTGNGTIYPNLPIAMVNAGVINSAAYSLWLNDLDSSTGSVLFGGVDTAKYTGDLISIEVYPSTRSGSRTSFTVAFTSLSATSSSGTDQLTPSGYAQAAILDSGTTITLLPDNVANEVFAELGATYEPSLGAVVCPCSLANNPGTLNYGFGGTGGPVIKVAMSELVLPLVLTDGRVPTYTNGAAACQLGIQAAGDLPILFGDTFLRSAYVVYDLENNHIGLAQTDFNTTKSNIVAFASAGAPIPSAVTASGQAQVTQTATGNPKVGESATATGTGAAATATFNPTATGLSAASGFAATVTNAAGASATSSKKSAGGRIEPFAWSRVVLAAVTVGMMGVGSGFFALL